MALAIKKGSDVKPLVCHSTGGRDLDQIFMFPERRFGVVYGPSSGGKSTILMEHVAARQQADPKFTCLLIAAESMDGIEDRYYETHLGVDLDRLDVVPTGDVPPMEELFDFLLGSNMMAAKKGPEEAHLKRYNGAVFKEYDLVLVDSFDALSARQEYLDTKKKSRGVTNDNPGVKARKFSEALRRICAALDNLDCAMYGICQTRADIGGYGALHKVTCGEALKYYASFRLAVKRGDRIQDGTGTDAKTIGFERKVCLEKTKISGNELKVAISPFIFGVGLDTFIGDFNSAIGPIIDAKGAFYYYEGFPESGTKKKRVIQGRDNAIQFFRADPTRMARLKEELDKYYEDLALHDTGVREENPAEAIAPPTIVPAEQ